MIGWFVITFVVAFAIGAWWNNLHIRSDLRGFALREIEDRERFFVQSLKLADAKPMPYDWRRNP